VSRRSALAGALTSLVLLGGCAVGGPSAGSDGDEAQSLHARPDLARKAQVAAENQMSGEEKVAGRQRPRAGRGGAEPDRPRRRGRSAGAVDTPPSREAASGTPRVGSGTTLATTSDQRADHGSGPGHADLTAVDFSERQGALSVRVTVGSRVPGALARREVEGVGIDFFRSSSQESDYQVFLDGGDGGWRAFLQTPNGFVRFPGHFGVDDRTFYVTVPWDALGGRGETKVSVFADWSSGTGRVSGDQTDRLTLSPG
jgi:hypothetical protein